MKSPTTHFKNTLQEFDNCLSHLYNKKEIKQLLLILYEEYLGIRPVDTLSSPMPLPAQVDEEKIMVALQKLTNGVPIQYILSKAWFMDTTLHVNPDVLIPRRETEELCTQVISDYHELEFSPESVIDFGTGSGCIAISIKRAFPNAVVKAIDLSKAALEVAKINAKKYNISIDFFQADLTNRDDPETHPGGYSLIISNPPYVTHSERQFMHINVTGFEPHSALFVPDEDPLLFYRSIADYATKHLQKKGRIYLEINERFGKEVTLLFNSRGFTNISLLLDMQGKERFVRVIAE